jgi:hypothetical protein
MHFGPLTTTPTDDIDERDDDDDDNGWFVGGVTTRSPTLIPPGTPYPAARTANPPYCLLLGQRRRGGEADR